MLTSVSSLVVTVPLGSVFITATVVDSSFLISGHTALITTSLKGGNCSPLREVMMSAVCPDIEDQEPTTVPVIKTEPRRTFVTKKETDVSIHNKDGVARHR